MKRRTLVVILLNSYHERISYLSLFTILVGLSGYAESEIKDLNLDTRQLSFLN